MDRFIRWVQAKICERFGHDVSRLEMFTGPEPVVYQCMQCSRRGDDMRRLWMERGERWRG